MQANPKSQHQLDGWHIASTILLGLQKRRHGLSILVGMASPALRPRLSHSSTMRTGIRSAICLANSTFVIAERITLIGERDVMVRLLEEAHQSRPHLKGVK